MVKIRLLIIFLLFTFPLQVFAASFNATVDRANITVEETFALKLSLKNTKALSSPDIYPLKNNFHILGQQNFSNVTIINGQKSINNIWQYTLMPKHVGVTKIPALTIKTQNGTLKSTPFTLTISKKPQHLSLNNQVATINATVSKKSPYVNEAIVYTVKIMSQNNVTNLALEPLESDSMILEKLGKQKSYTKIIDGHEINIIEIKYLITPLKAGVFTIPSIILQGKIRTGKSRIADPFSIFEDDFFSRGFKNFNSMFDQYKSFSLASKEIHLNVKKPAVNMDPWLPLNDLKITEEWDTNAPFKQGEPLYRKLTLTAKGLPGNQLPSMEKQATNDAFKHYIDQPETGEKILKGDTKPTGWRKESYTLIPQKSGKLILPEIRIPWWNLKENKINYAILPARTVKVLANNSHMQKPLYINTNIPTSTIEASQTKVTPSPAALTTLKSQKPLPNNNFLYIIIIGLLSLIVGLVLFIFKRLTQSEKIVTKPVVKQLNLPAKVPNLNKISTTKELKNYVQIYALHYWEQPKNTALRTIAENTNNQKISLLIQQLENALYAQKKLDIKVWKNSWNKALKTVKLNKKSTKKKLTPLNPT